MAASSPELTAVETSAVSLLPRSAAAASLPLTFFDIPWLSFSPAETIFFFDFPTSTANFMQAILPNLKHSLSITLKHFFPLAGKLVMPPCSAVPYIECAPDDSVLLSVAEAVSGDFKNLVGHHRRPARDFLGLVPLLKSSSKFGTKKKDSLLAIQVTIFPCSGFCIGFTLRNVVTDGRTFKNFLKTWAASSSSLIKTNENLDLNEHLVACHDRSLINDQTGLKEILLQEWRYAQNPQRDGIYNQASLSPSDEDMERATFVMSPKEMKKIHNWILARSDKQFGSTQLLLSPYVITNAFVWVCWMKTHWSNSEYQDYVDHESLHYFGFIAGGITRLSYSVPGTYCGNCVGFGRSEARRVDLLGENGVLHSAKAIGNTIKRLNSDVLRGAKNWISEWEVMRESELHLTVTGSPKLDLYGLDFWWGPPVKIEEISIDRTRSISLSESREVIGGIEIGICLPKSKMECFWALFNKGLG